MKPLKKAEQKNVVINTEYYSKNDIEAMWFAGEIVCLDEKNFGQFLEPKKIGTFDRLDEYDFRLFLEYVKDLKVTLDDYGHYTTVAVGNNGKTYYINLI